jgi:fumarate hydratase subunit beta
MEAPSPISIELPLRREQAASLRAGDRVSFSGLLYTARDAAHKRLVELVRAGKPLPFPLEDAVVYYVGPTPARPGGVIGSAGPTTSYRMDAYAPTLIEGGLRGMIGKGKRSDEVTAAMVRGGAVYFGAIGGAGALLADRIRAAEIIAFADLGPEAIRRLRVEDFPAVVVIDCLGNNLYRSGREAYLAASREKNL